MKPLISTSGASAHCVSGCIAVIPSLFRRSVLEKFCVADRCCALKPPRNSFSSRELKTKLYAKVSPSSISGVLYVPCIGPPPVWQKLVPQPSVGAETTCLFLYEKRAKRFCRELSVRSSRMSPWLAEIGVL